LFVFLEKKVYIALFTNIINIMSGIYEGYASVPYDTVYTVEWGAADKTMLVISNLGPPSRLIRRPVAS
jgi:hypothetical protein